MRFSEDDQARRRAPFLFRPGNEAAREQLDVWYDRFPDSDGDVRGRLLSEQDDGIVSALAELSLFNRFVERLGVAPIVHPTMSTSSKRPDFLVGDIYVEAAALIGTEHFSMVRLRAVAAEILRRGKATLPNVWLSFVDESTDEVSDFDNREIASRFLSHAHRSIEEDFTWKRDELALRIMTNVGTLPPRSGRCEAGAFVPLAFTPNRHEIISRKLRDKSPSKYGVSAEHPYVLIFISHDIHSDLEAVLDAVLGLQAVEVAVEPSGVVARRWGRTRTNWNPVGGGEPRDRRISAVGFMQSPLHSATLQTDLVLVENPWASAPITGRPLGEERRATWRALSDRFEMEWLSIADGEQPKLSDR